MNLTPAALPHSCLLTIILGAALGAQLTAADLTLWPSQYLIRPWETARLTPADVVGPDGIVYPDFTGVGVTGGIPDINNSTIRATYTVFNVRDHGATGDGVTNDDATVATAVAAATAHAAIPGNKTILYFPAGTYLLSAPIVFSHNDVVIDGDGPDATLLKIASPASPGPTNSALLYLRQTVGHSQERFLTTMLPRGANTLHVPSVDGYTVGSWARLHTSTTTGKAPHTTMSRRYSNPDNHVIYDEILQQVGRVLYGKVIAIDPTANTITLDRTATHDFYVDDESKLRVQPFLEYCGVQDLSIETLDAKVTLDPVRFDQAADSWVKNIRILKAVNFPIILNTVTRFEVRDSRCEGTWADINRGSTAYFGWLASTDALMDNVQASDLRHMAVFQFANRSVIRASTFTGMSICSPQFHGRFPHDNLIEDCTFATVGLGGESTRGLSALASDGSATLRHGVVGPRNVFYNNRVDTGMGSVQLGGINEGLIFVYNRVLKTDDTEVQPSFRVADRTFDAIVRGNVFQSITSLPFISFEDPTCTGWSVTDNRIHGSNGFLYEGDSAPAIAHNNLFFPDESSVDEATTPEVASIYEWQKKHAASARLVVVVDQRAVAEGRGITAGQVVRVKSPTDADLVVSLSSSTPGLAVPATITIPADAVSVPFTITGANISGGDKSIVLTANAAEHLSDSEIITVLDQSSAAKPNFGGDKWPVQPQGLPVPWKAGNFGLVIVEGEQTYTPQTDSWTISGGGVEFQKYHGSMARNGRRFVYQTLDGDGEIRARLTEANLHKQVGIMVADDEATLTDFISVEPTGRVISSSNDNGSPHGRPILHKEAEEEVTPIWLRIRRTGFVFTVYSSTAETPTTDTDWTELARVDMYKDSLDTNAADYKSPAVLDRRMHYGMFINSGRADSVGDATFTGVRITPATTPPESTH